MNYFVFTDEAGVYQRRPNDSHIRSHPFYIRSNVLMSIDDYRQYQIDMQRIAGEYEIPFDEEIKWSDLWGKVKNNPRTATVAKMPVERLKGYYRKVLETATSKLSTVFVFTVTNMHGSPCFQKESTIYEFHLRNAFQRIRYQISESDFAVFVMDELNVSTVKQIKNVCHAITVKGDFVEYKNLYQGVLTENSLYSPGIQLADYVAGVLNGYLRGKIVSHGKYQFATDLFEGYIKTRLRRSNNGQVVGYGIVAAPNNQVFKEKLIEIFDYKGKEIV